MTPNEYQSVEEMQDEIERLKAILNTPQYEPFLKAVASEAKHQDWRWPEEHDLEKEPEDWFWLIGYLTGKALRAHIDHDREKALHHTISSAAALAHWHQAVLRDTPDPQCPIENTELACREQCQCEKNLQKTEVPLPRTG